MSRKRIGHSGARNHEFIGSEERGFLAALNRSPVRQTRSRSNGLINLFGISASFRLKTSTHAIPIRYTNSHSSRKGTLPSRIAIGKEKHHAEHENESAHLLRYDEQQGGYFRLGRPEKKAHHHRPATENDDEAPDCSKQGENTQDDSQAAIGRSWHGSGLLSPQKEGEIA